MIKAARGTLLKWINDVAVQHMDKDECLEWPFGKDRGGYGKLKVDGKFIGSHRYVCIKTNGNQPDGMEVSHNCGNRSCVNPHHLRWDTKSGNQKDRLIHGTDLRGEKCPKHKLNKYEVKQIKEKVGSCKSSELCKQYNVSSKTVRDIWNGRTWYWL